MGGSNSNEQSAVQQKSRRSNSNRQSGVQQFGSGNSNMQGSVQQYGPSRRANVNSQTGVQQRGSGNSNSQRDVQQKYRRWNSNSQSKVQQMGGDNSNSQSMVQQKSRRLNSNSQTQIQQMGARYEQDRSGTSSGDNSRRVIWNFPGWNNMRWINNLEYSLNKRRKTQSKVLLVEYCHLFTFSIQLFGTVLEDFFLLVSLLIGCIDRRSHFSDVVHAFLIQAHRRSRDLSDHRFLLRTTRDATATAAAAGDY